MYTTIVTITTEDSEGFCHDYDYLVNTDFNPQNLSPEDTSPFDVVMRQFVMPEGEVFYSGKCAYNPIVIK